jgi:hypothetical protein
VQDDLLHYRSASGPHRLASGKMKPVRDQAEPVSYGAYWRQPDKSPFVAAVRGTVVIAETFIEFEGERKPFRSLRWPKDAVDRIFRYRPKLWQAALLFQGIDARIVIRTTDRATWTFIVRRPRHFLEIVESFGYQTEKKMQRNLI